MWCGVGIMLISFAVIWLFAYKGERAILFAAAGVISALPVHFLGFSKIAQKNIARIMLYNTPRCIFSFMTFRSWLTVFVMMAMGIGLRGSSLPKEYLAILYIAIGTGLLLSGITYMKRGIMLFMNSDISSGR
jgi:hypothetical protein